MSAGHRKQPTLFVEKVLGQSVLPCSKQCEVHVFFDSAKNK